MKATEVTAGLAERNGSLLPGLWRDSLHVTCGLTACTPGSALGPTLGNELIPAYYSDWVTLRGGMPQGSWLGPLIFIILIDDLWPRLLTHKFVDDTTLSEIKVKGTTSKMQQAVDDLITCHNSTVSTSIARKQRKWYLGHWIKTQLYHLQYRYPSRPYKILGVMVNSDLKWDDHVTSITSKAGKRLWFMKQLRRAGVCQDDLLYYYQAVVRPVLEYASPCWQTSLTKEQTKQLEDVQRRALQIIWQHTVRRSTSYM